MNNGNRRKRRVTYRPNKPAAILAGVVGALFAILGIFVVIPNFGGFGVIWTLVAVGIAALNLYQAFGNRYVGPEIVIEEEDEAPGRTLSAEEEKTVTARLEELESLHNRGLINREEYEATRQKILKDL